MAKKTVIWGKVAKFQSFCEVLAFDRKIYPNRPYCISCSLLAYDHLAQGGALLVLTRRANQSIVISDDIVITILDIHRDQVRVGISAPRDVEIHREEVYLAVKAANEAAATSPKALGIDMGEIKMPIDDSAKE
ncbi:carbon storage regulator CsrA [Acidithrix ferrooxidans]|uniref:carbon storage regulator CsrA n=1 Tax=Acidithrix ferrooxidans TaxID=1280514 RepID=UPI001F2384F8|nr:MULTISPECIES: carbon storage regulator CsrA [Acidithrix]